MVVPGSRLRKRPWRTAAICSTAASAMAPTFRGCTFQTQPRAASLRVAWLLEQEDAVSGVADHRAVWQQGGEGAVVFAHDFQGAA